MLILIPANARVEATLYDEASLERRSWVGRQGRAALAENLSFESSFVSVGAAASAVRSAGVAIALDEWRSCRGQAGIEPTSRNCHASRTLATCRFDARFALKMRRRALRVTTLLFKPPPPPDESLQLRRGESSRAKSKSPQTADTGVRWQIVAPGKSARAPTSEEYAGELAANTKEAEKSAAQQALQALPARPRPSKVSRFHMSRFRSPTGVPNHST